ncbi:unnamed protein product [Urochloa decumbens]|uniref:Uncharacterized protein n=1 Tax=Urochloa decumbens TaxID=240449 RepID=A0ABC9BCS8_9POAL
MNRDKPNMCRRCRSSSRTTMPVIDKREKNDDEDESTGHLAPEKLEVLAHLEPWAEAHVLPLLKPFNAAWQPSDFLPDAAALGDDEGFYAACRDLRARAAGVPDAILVCLVGNMVTEEALPTYQSVPNRFEGARDLTGADATAWARWIRGWSAEENRHGDVLSRYLLLSGRVDMRQVDATVHRLIAAGMDAMGAAARCPYHGFVYVAFQERATAISHGNTARLVAGGDAALARICGAITADEKRHEAAYTRIVGKLFEVEPDAAVRALGYMMRRRISMPAALMDDGRDGDLYAHYSAAAEQARVYTASDYREILEHMIGKWGVQELAVGLSGEGRRARDYVCGLPEKIRRVEEKAHDRAAARAKKKPTDVPFSWIFDRPVSVALP